MSRPQSGLTNTENALGVARLICHCLVLGIGARTNEEACQLASRTHTRRERVIYGATGGEL